MTETELLKALRDSGVGAQTVAAVALVYLSVKVNRLDARVRAVADTINACPTCRKHANIIPVILALLLALLTFGCVRTHVRLGDAEMTRTAFLTRVDVPAIEVATNGTFRASVKSDARTELLESVLRLLTSAAK